MPLHSREGSSLAPVLSHLSLSLLRSLTLSHVFPSLSYILYMSWTLLGFLCPFFSGSCALFSGSCALSSGSCVSGLSHSLVSGLSHSLVSGLSHSLASRRCRFWALWPLQLMVASGLFGLFSSCLLLGSLASSAHGHVWALWPLQVMVASGLFGLFSSWSLLGSLASSANGRLWALWPLQLCLV